MSVPPVPAPASDAEWARLGAEQFVSLGTFRRNGELVAKPVWIAPDGETLVVTSERATGKIKRLRNDERVVLQPCGRMGALLPGSVPSSAVATVDDSPAMERSATAALRRKYGRFYGVLLRVERLIRRLQRRPGDRVIVRISRPADTAA